MIIHFLHTYIKRERKRLIARIKILLNMLNFELNNYKSYNTNESKYLYLK